MVFLPGTDRSVCEMEDVMKIDTQIVDRYLSGKPLLTGEEDRIPLDQSALEMDRREVVAELKTRTLASLQQFPSFNPALFQALFPALDICQKRLHVHLLVGSSDLCRTAKSDASFDVFIDLIQAANRTRIVSQMMYLILHTLHYEFARHCLLIHWPDSGRSYHERLDHLCFVEGLATYLAWNENAADYRFYTDRYEQKKEQAFGLLYHAFQIDDAKVQEQILSAPSDIPFWNQFWVSASLFYLDDLYRSTGSDGLQSFCTQGGRHFVETIFDLN